MKQEWPGKETVWLEGRILYASIPFTWNLPGIRRLLAPKPLYIDRAIVGGPAVKLMPDYLAGLDHVTIGDNFPGILQRINPNATRTTTGCVNRCGFCGVKTIEPKFTELEDWPDRPVICDNNLLAASMRHFDRVIDRLIVHGWCDFNQGIDSRLLTDYHAMRIAEIKKPIVRLALDHVGYADQWECAYDRLRAAGVAKRNIRSYALIGFNSGPDEAWERCHLIERHNIKCAPMWFHELDALEHNTVTEKQMALGWNDYERRRIMQWFYKHKIAVAA